MLPLADAVQDLPWRIVFLDLPWAEDAAATATAKSAVDVAAGVLAEIDAHLGDEPFAVVGNSFGGMIARHVAHERPRRRDPGGCGASGTRRPCRPGAHRAARRTVRP
ncbi:alpha/beta fold hydrolase [Curtobacterium flaccumfaciens]|uniref:alpha/beta fold hydrolase n=1 Tax=Curtobacterium flaccumfaciens TaxID=2035 RepID=UPI0039A0C428